MCGVIGYIGKAPLSSGGVISSMLYAQGHRGPDGWGLASWEGLGSAPRVWKGPSIAGLDHSIGLTSGALWLGHNWLAIQDRSPHAQMPIFSDDGRYSLVYNGEIYNFVELREALETAGRAFATGSDAEVLLRLWQAEGSASLDRLRGMFAFLIYDSFERTLYAARDPLGIKPLYYSRLDGAVAFASEIRAFHASGLVKRRFDRDAAVAFLAAGVNKPGEETTIYEGVLELPPGTVMAVGEGGFRTRRYATLPELNPSLSGGEALDALRSSVIDSVSAHLISGRPVASCMSGGLDSTNIAAAIRRARPGASCPYTVFTLGPASGEDEELRLAGAAARSLGIAQRVARRPSVVDLSDVVDMVVTCETPNHVIGPINQYLLIRHIANEPDGIKVVLDGQGGDELLSGYPWYSGFLLDEIRKTDEPLYGEISASYGASLPLSPEMHAALARMFTDPAEWVRAFDDGMGAVLGTRPEEVLRLGPVQYYLSNSTDWRSFRSREYFQGELQYLLRQEDRIGMRFGMECRVPYVDIPTIRTAAMMKPEFLMKDGLLKYPFRALFPEIAAEVLSNRVKRGFWDVSTGAFPYLRPLAEAAARSSAFICGLVRDMGGDLSALDALGDYAVWRILQVAVLEDSATSGDGAVWASRFEWASGREGVARQTGPPGDRRR
jgi:asparagine synthase (glutamine-hydrolysing)